MKNFVHFLSGFMTLCVFIGILFWGAVFASLVKFLCN